MLLSSIKYTVTAVMLLFSSLMHSQNTDIDLLKKINVERNVKLDNTFKYLSYSAAPVTIAEPVVLFTAWMIRKDSLSKANFLTAAFSVGISEALTFGLKYSIGRERPFTTYSFIQPYERVTTPSFPSGHTSSAFAVATSLTLCYKKWYVAVSSYLWAAGVGYSRMHLGVHYPSDVLVGAIIGSAAAFFGYKTQQWILK